MASVNIIQTQTLNQDQIKALSLLEKKVFPHTPLQKSIQKKLSSKENLFSLLAYEDQSLIGCKIGYPLEGNEFYSWYGGVDPSYRKKGYARLMMELQHQELKKRGYKKVITKTRAPYREMLILNLQQGFSIVRCETKPQVDSIIIVFEKNL